MAAVDVVALVGPAGSGKSHRASYVAHQHDCEAIIDDGLLIQDGKIIAGSSAKKEESKLAAVKRAIFLDSDHRSQVRAAIRSLRPERLLVLGTSTDMIEKICDGLDIPRPDTVVRIEEIATPNEIRLARRSRLQGKHVIPAPTMEVKKTFSGYLVDPIRFLLKRAEDGDLQLEKSVVRPTFSQLGKFFIADTVVSQIATHAAERVPGVKRVNRVVVETRTEGVVIDVEVTLIYGHQLWEVMAQAQAETRAAVEHMTALNVLELNLDGRRLVPE